MIEIPISRGAVAWVDDIDVALVRAIAWQLWERGQHRYAISSVRENGGRRRTGSMHRFIMRPPAGMMVDHIDGDGLNNTRANLRVVTRGQNRSNSVKRAVAGSSFKGVYRIGERWRAQISADGLPSKPWWIGDFQSAEDAARAYDAVARIMFREHARLNFPRPGELSALEAA